MLHFIQWKKEEREKQEEEEKKSGVRAAEIVILSMK